MKNFNVKNVVLGLIFLSSFSMLDERVASRCTFTGEIGDSCMVGEVGRNVRVLNCTRGATSCYYDSPPIISEDWYIELNREGS